MCNPLLAWGAAALAGGAAANAYGARKSETAAVKVRRAKDMRQDAFKNDAEAGFRKNMSATSADAINADMGRSTKAREAAYAAANAAAPRATAQAASGSLGGNKVVSDNLAQMLSSIGSRVAEQGNARARLGSFGDAMFNADILTGRGRQQIAQAGNFAQGSLRPLSAEVEAASHKGDKAHALGSLLTAVGSALIGGAGAAAGGTGAAGAGGIVTNPSTGMLAQPFMSSLPASTFGAGWLAPVAAL